MYVNPTHSCISLVARNLHTPLGYNRMTPSQASFDLRSLCTLLGESGMWLVYMQINNGLRFVRTLCCHRTIGKFQWPKRPSHTCDVFNFAENQVRIKSWLSQSPLKHIILKQKFDTNGVAFLAEPTAPGHFQYRWICMVWVWLSTKWSAKAKDTKGERRT